MLNVPYIYIYTYTKITNKRLNYSVFIKLTTLTSKTYLSADYVLVAEVLKFRADMARILKHFDNLFVVSWWHCFY